MDTENICGQKRIMNKIFICVPAQNDKDYLKTVERAYEFSSNPDNISIGTTVFWKEKDLNGTHKPFFINIKNGLDKNFKKVKYDIQPWANNPGVSRGRFSASKHYNNEKYFLSIDSHTDFTENWDLQMIDLYENSRQYFGKLRVITSYLSPYVDAPSGEYNQDIFTHMTAEDNPKNYSAKTLYLKNEIVGNRWPFFDFHKKIGVYNNSDVNDLVPLPNEKPLSDEAIIKHLSEKMIDGKYIPAHKISAHFYFTESDPWLTKYNMNLYPDIMWWGEEFTQSLISYSRGYNFVWVKPQIIFHKYSSYEKVIDNILETSHNKKDSTVFFRSYEEDELEEFESDNDRYNFYMEYIYSTFLLEGSSSYLQQNRDDFQIIKEIIDNKKIPGYLPRSLEGFLKYEKIDFNTMRSRQWWEVPEVNVVYK